ncbi:HK97-gp10 family putative phage morphogenesis protein [Oerskovia paurometabola]|uniref:HK97-gp10 family putative phage morphogenesis protein n=1 Tax=Oerskovia paurometabola TaxID=162170 RepID=UPI003439BC67
MGVDGSDLRRLSRDLSAAGQTVGPLASVAVRKSTLDVERDGKTFAPVDTGNLRSTIGSEVFETATSVTGEVGPTASYGGFVETGTSVKRPQPFMGPALDRNAPLLDAAIDQVIGRALP